MPGGNSDPVKAVDISSMGAASPANHFLTDSLQTSVKHVIPKVWGLGLVFTKDHSISFVKMKDYSKMLTPRSW